MAILSLLTIIPKNRNLSIFTDSQTAIQLIQPINNNKITTNTPKHQNYHLTSLIHHIINNHNIHLTLHKITAHSGNIHNELADQLAKAETIQLHTPTLQPNYKFLDTIQTTTHWNNQIIETPIKQILKHLFFAKHTILWRLLNRNKNTINNFHSKTFNWQQSLIHLQPSNLNKPPTNILDHNYRSFQNKLWNLELLTKSKLHNRNPQIYQNNICTKCNKTSETSTHPFTCLQQSKITKNKIRQILNEEISSQITHKIQSTLNQKLLETINLWSLETLNIII